MIVKSLERSECRSIGAMLCAVRIVCKRGAAPFVTGVFITARLNFLSAPCLLPKIFLPPHSFSVGPQAQGFVASVAVRRSMMIS